ncbi:unnamed protein product, partial [Symbiodinium microadriaticum]
LETFHCDHKRGSGAGAGIDVAALWFPPGCRKGMGPGVTSLGHGTTRTIRILFCDLADPARGQCYEDTLVADVERWRASWVTRMARQPRSPERISDVRQAKACPRTTFNGDQRRDPQGPGCDNLHTGKWTTLCSEPVGGLNEGRPRHTEEEATYIQAYHEAYLDIKKERDGDPAASFPSYQDVRKEMQDRRKGRQYLKPGKGKGKGKSHKGKNKGKQAKGSKKGRGKSLRGTREELLKRTRCHGCGELGHFVCDCPDQAYQEPEKKNFIVSQGRGNDTVNRTFMVTEARPLMIFAGVRTLPGQGLVDSAAEDAVMGTSAFERLRAQLAQHALRPVKRDRRVTVINDEHDFETEEFKDLKSIGTSLGARQDTIKGLSGYRVSFIDQTAADLFVINDVWNGWFRESTTNIVGNLSGPAASGGRDDEQPGAATNSSGPSLVPPLVAVSGATARAHAGGDAGAAAGERPASRGDGTDNELIPQPADRREQKQYTRNQQPLRRGIGHPVTRSKAKKAWDLEPQNCTHPEDELYMQGNRARFWWTCLRCGSRWSRLECKTDVGNSTDRVKTGVGYRTVGIGSAPSRDTLAEQQADGASPSNAVNGPPETFAINSDGEEKHKSPDSRAVPWRAIRRPQAQTRPYARVVMPSGVTEEVKKVIHSHGHVSIASLAILISSMCSPLVAVTSEQKLPWSLLEATMPSTGEQFTLYYVQKGYHDLGTSDHGGCICSLPRTSFEFITQQIFALCGDPPSTLTTTMSGRSSETAFTVVNLTRAPDSTWKRGEHLQQAVESQRIFLLLCAGHDQQPANTLLPSHFYLHIGPHQPHNNTVCAATNDKTLAKMLANTPWEKAALLDVDANMATVISSLEALLQAASPAPQSTTASLAPEVQRLLPGWLNLVRATQDHTNFMTDALALNFGEGAVKGPAWWRRTFLDPPVTKLKYRINPYDSCVLVLPNLEQPATTAEGVRPPSLGFLIVEVDDIIEDLYEAASTYTGRKICQLRDHSFHIHMEEYIYARLAPVQLGRKVFHKDAANTPWLQGEKTQLRGVIQSLAWVAREARPDAAAAASVLASTFPEASVADIFDTNVMVRHLKQVPIRLTVHSIPEKDVRHVLIADAAFDTSGQAKSQHGWLQGYTDPSLNAGAIMSAATASLEKQVALWDSLRFSNFSPREQQRPEDLNLELHGKATVISSESPLFMDPNSAITKALYDNLVSGQPGRLRTSLEEMSLELEYRNTFISVQ